jgi:hypothetical protein
MTLRSIVRLRIVSALTTKPPLLSISSAKNKEILTNIHFVLYLLYCKSHTVRSHIIYYNLILYTGHPDYGVLESFHYGF